MKPGMILMAYLLLQSSALSVEFAGGTGEPNDPYQIATAEQLIGIDMDPNLLDRSFVLVVDLDLDPNLPGGRIFEDALIAPDDHNDVNSHGGVPFSGILDGRDHTITNLHITGKHGYDAGLFGEFEGLVKDLNLSDVVVSGSPCGAIAGLNRGVILRCRVTGQISGVKNVGGLVGFLRDASIVECQAQVQVAGDRDVGGLVGFSSDGTLIGCEAQVEVSGNLYVGGLVGVSQEGQILECRTTGMVIGGSDVGGLIGYSFKTTIIRSLARCEVTAEQTAGGLVGNAYRSTNSPIKDCYARGSITGSIVGGLAGEARHNQFVNCYAACEIFPMQIEDEELFVGGLFGDVGVPVFAPTTISCFWDTELSGVTAGTGSHPLELGTGMTTEEMHDQEVFQSAGWDFDTVWMICEGDYPRLQWEDETCDNPQP